MRILTVSHSCVADINQQLFIEMNRLPDTEIALMMPETWKDEYSGAFVESKMLPAVDFPVFLLPIGKPGSVNLHYYKKLPFKPLQDWKPDVLLSTQEPY